MLVSSFSSFLRKWFPTRPVEQEINMEQVVLLHAGAVLPASLHIVVQVGLVADLQQGMRPLNIQGRNHTTAIIKCLPMPTHPHMALLRTKVIIRTPMAIKATLEANKMAWSCNNRKARISRKEVATQCTTRLVVRLLAKAETGLLDDSGLDNKDDWLVR